MAVLISPREIVETYAEGSITEAASFAAEGARIVCHVRTTSVPTIYRILGEFYTAVYAMNDAAEYLRHDLTRAAETGDLYHAQGGDPQVATEEARKYLAEVSYHARELGKKLEAAQQAIAPVGHNDDGRSA